MAVSLVVPIQHRPFRGALDPGLPTGIWIVQSSVLGDAGGGLLSFDVLFKDGSLPVPESSLMYNLEQINLFTTGGGNSDISLNPANWDEISPGATGSVVTVFHVLLQDVGSIAQGAGLATNGMPLPWFFGQVRKNTTNTILRISMTNSVLSLACKAEGYVWGPGAINAPGGPRRPEDSLYG